MDSNSGRVFRAAVVFSFLSFSSNMLFLSAQLRNDDKASTFTQTNCTHDSECTDLCHQGNFLSSRCDRNGTCICDCSDKAIVNSSYTSACTGQQPEGHWWDYCDYYCRQEYRRPCRYCSSDQASFYCTCVCNYGKKSEEEDEERYVPK